MAQQRACGFLFDPFVVAASLLLCDLHDGSNCAISDPPTPAHTVIQKTDALKLFRSLKRRSTYYKAAGMTEMCVIFLSTLNDSWTLSNRFDTLLTIVIPGLNSSPRPYEI
jgi:hypothetical protein